MTPTPTTTSESDPLVNARVLRVWPGVVLVVIQWLVRFVMPAVVPGTGGAAVMGGMAGGLAVLLWWLLFSRARWQERLGVPVGMALAVWLTTRGVHPSIAGGMMGMMPTIYILPLLSLALVAWAWGVRRGGFGPARWVGLAIGVAMACGVMMLVRTGGMSGDAGADLHWRWTQTPEERLLAAGEPPPTALPAAGPVNGAGSSGGGRVGPGGTAAGISAAGAGSWPGFRGGERDGVVRGVRLGTDWARSAPVERWRRAVGPAWSSFAVQDGFVYTQEQRGAEEMVVCLRLANGEPVWGHRDPVRFWESNAGAGPRGTPTLHRGRVFAVGGTGLLNALDAATGRSLWRRDLVVDTGRKAPDWGYAGSPLVLGDRVVVAASGVLAAYDVGTGERLWTGPEVGWGYSSPHLATFDGVEQVLLLNGAGVVAVAPVDGRRLWDHAWKNDGIVQPTLLGQGDLVIGSGSGLGSKVGLRRLHVAQGTNGWTVEERWTSIGLRPYFSDIGVHRGHAYGFDGGLLSCVDLADGKRRWKDGRYGHGQLLVLAEQDLLLVLSEDGQIVLVRADSAGFVELARHPAIRGKTWNHPVLSGGLLLVRNAEEMAAFALPAERP